MYGDFHAHIKSDVLLMKTVLVASHATGYPHYMRETYDKMF